MATLNSYITPREQFKEEMKQLGGQSAAGANADVTDHSFKSFLCYLLLDMESLINPLHAVHIIRNVDEYYQEFII